MTTDSRKTQKDVIRIGDTVRIVKPERFIRCGYDNNLQSNINKLLEKKEDCEQLYSILSKLSGAPYGINDTFSELLDSSFFKEDTRLRDRVIREIAYQRMVNQKRHGSARRIFTEEEPSIAGLVSTVEQIKFVKTGTYYAASSYSGADGYEYDPAYLEDEKTHKIIRLAHDLSGERDFSIFRALIQDSSWIEADNVEKVQQ